MQENVLVVMRKVGLNFFSEFPYIDFFGMSLSKEDLKRQLNKCKYDYGVTDKLYFNNLDEDDIENIDSQIRKIVLLESREEPNIVRYGIIPNFFTCGIDIIGLAKIHNNGATYVFAGDEDFFKYLDYEDSFYIDCKEIY